MKKPKVLDIETNGTNPWDGELLILGWGNDDGFEVYDVAHDGLPPEVMAELADPEQPVVSHTGYDIRWHLLAGDPITGPYYDTQSMAHTLSENTPLDLDWLARRYANIEMDKRLRRLDKRMFFRSDSGKHWALDEWRKWPEEVWGQFMDYNRRDIEAGWALYEALEHRLQASEWWDHWVSEEVPFTGVLRRMEAAGLDINLEASDRLHEALMVEYAQREKALHEKFGYEFNLRSGDQLAKVLFEKVWQQKDSLRLPPEVVAAKSKPGYMETLYPNFKTKKAAADHAKENPEEYEEYVRELLEEWRPAGFVPAKAGRDLVHGYWMRKGLGLRATPPTVDKDGNQGDRPSTATPVLLVHHADQPIIQELVAYRKVNKILTTYTGKYREHSHNGRLYGRFNQTGTKTGRLSSSGPNLQNQPAHGPLGHAIRSLFQGSFLIGDYSQLEPRLMAHFSGDPVLLDTYRTGKDIYLVTASGIFGEPVTSKEDDRRQIAKTYILALGYGAGPKKLVEILALNGFKFELEEVKHHYDQLQNLYGVFFDWREAVIASVRTRGHVQTIGGRHRRLKYAFKDTSWRQQGYGERQAVNAIIQGSAGDVVRRAMIAHDARLDDWDMDLVFQVHDEEGFRLRNPEGHSQQHWQEVLDEVTSIAVEGHGFDLRVPLVFEPAYVDSWAGKGTKTLVLPGDGEEDDE